MLNKLHSKYTHVYAIVRVDAPIDADTPANCISVIGVFLSHESSIIEAERLNQLNGHNGCIYISYVTRLVMKQRE